MWQTFILPKHSKLHSKHEKTYQSDILQKYLASNPQHCQDHPKQKNLWKLSEPRGT